MPGPVGPGSDGGGCALPPSREVVIDLLAALRSEFDRLSDENGRLRGALVQLNGGQQSAPLTSDFAANPCASPPPPTFGPAEYVGNGTPEAQGAVLEVKPASFGSALVLPSESSAIRPRATEASQLAAEERYEKFYDLTRTFNNLCAGHRASISMRELVAMAAGQQHTSVLNACIVEFRPRLEVALKALNASLGITNAKSDEPVCHISLDAFIAIMQRKTEFFRTAEGEVLETMAEIRDILVREDAFRKVAKATNTTTGEIYAASQHALTVNWIDRVVKYLDPLIGLVIILNAIIICISTDVARDSKVWDWVEVTFTLVFVAELGIKLAAHGVCAFFLGPDMYWNLFDTIVVLIAAVDFAFTMLGEIVPLRNFTIIRLLRFARLTRLVRVLKLKVFKELTLMINGIFVGFRTLVWAVIFLGFLLFALGVLLTQTVGHTAASDWTSICDGVDGDDAVQACGKSASHLASHRSELFGNVFRSMFTVFRCFTDGCSSVDGTPLIPYFYNTHGLLVVFIYMLVILFVIFGLFNLIMAIFVENTIANAKVNDARRREARSKEQIHLATKLQELIVLFCTGGDESDDEEEGRPKRWDSFGWFRSAFGTRSTALLKDPSVTKNLSNLSLQVTHSTFAKMIDKPEVKTMLDDLDISVGSRASLFEVLDANCNGTLEVTELVQGLLKLRGTADKGDVVASLLGIRSIQKSIKAMEVLGLHQQRAIENIAAAQDRMESVLDTSDSLQKPWCTAARSASMPPNGCEKEMSKKCFQFQPAVRSTLDTLRASTTDGRAPGISEL